MSKKFWQVKNKVSGGSEILLYGEIASEASWFGDESTPKQFAADLEALEGAAVTVRINSCGGDVFAAHTIHNLLANYNGAVTVVIDGLAASAATIVAMAGDKVIMPANTLMMIHNPMIYGNNYYTADELEKMAGALDKIKSSIIAAYRKRTGLSADKLADMMDDETWMSAEECLKLGFADEVSGAADSVVIDGKMLIANSMQYDISNFKNITGLKAQIKNKGETSLTKLEQILAKMGLLDEVAAAENSAAAPAAGAIDAAEIKARALAKERQRIADIEALAADGNAAVNAIADVAKKEGREAAEVKPYIDAVKALPFADNSAAQKLFADMVAENAASGVNGVAPAPAVNADEFNAAADAKAAEEMINFMNQFAGRKK